MWKNYPDEKPKKGIDVIAEDENGYKHYVYLCNHCGSEWRDSSFGHGLMIEVKRWKYLDDV